MKAFAITALLLSATAYAQANYDTAPKPYSCAQAKADGDQILVLACEKFAAEQRVRVTFPAASAKPRGEACGDKPENCSAQVK